MMRRASALGLGLVLLLGVGVARAQPGGFGSFPPPPAPPPPQQGSGASPGVVQGGAPTNLRGRFGLEMADHLMKSADADERLRGIQRAAAIGTPEAMGLLIGQADPNALGRTDSRALLELARALAPFTGDDVARSRLVAILGAPAPSPARRGELVTESVDAGARVALARATAARALAISTEPKALEALANAARLGGPGQTAAAAALGVESISVVDVLPRTTPLASVPALRALAQSGDLRSLDALQLQLGAADVPTRAAALLALAQLGDMRVAAFARAAMGEKDARLRAAAGEALVLLDAPERFDAVAHLVNDDATARTGIRLAERAQDTNVVGALATRLAVSSDPFERQSILTALGRGLTDKALSELVKYAADPRLDGDAVQAIARSPNAGAIAALEKLVQTPGKARLAVRGYVLRALLLGARSAPLDERTRALAASASAADRAVGGFARVALGDAPLDDALGDKDPMVRRAAAVASLALRGQAPAQTLLRHLQGEKDEATRHVLALGMRNGDPNGSVPTLILVDRAESGGADAPLSALALAQRKDDAQKKKLDTLLAARDPLLRLHVALGLAMNEDPESVGRLGNAFRYETDVQVRRAIVRSLALRKEDAPIRTEILRLAATLDPDGLVRGYADRAQKGLPIDAVPATLDVAWIRVIPAQGGAPPPLLGAYVTDTGLALPIAFDADGFALVPSVPPGEGRLVLEPFVP